MHFRLLTDNEKALEIGKRFKRARLLKNMTQQEVADEAGVTIYKIRDFEQKGKIPLVDFISILGAINEIALIEKFLQEDTYLDLEMIELINKKNLDRRKRASRGK